MQEENQITIEQDKPFSLFLWTIALSSLYWAYYRYAFVNQFPFGKGIQGLLLVTSEVSLLITSIRTYKEYYIVISPFMRVCSMLTIIYNIGHIAYVTVWDRDVALLSLFGNPLYQPLFMLPFAFFTGLKFDRLSKLYKCMWYYMIAIIPISLFTRHISATHGIFLLFLLALAYYLPHRKRLLLLAMALIYVIICYMHDSRAAVLRAVMGGAILFFSTTSLYKSRMVKGVIFFILTALPLYFISLFVTTGYSVFAQTLSSSNVTELVSEEHMDDTRTFLYEEVFEDLSENNSWVLGKGINGTYYSSYFDDKYSHEKENRFGAEVGLLFYMLKGGLIQTFLYLFILLAAIYKCLIKSNSKFVSLLGLVLLSHYVLLFIEEVPRYDLYNIAIWIFIGLAFAIVNSEYDDDIWFEEQINLML